MKLKNNVLLYSIFIVLLAGLMVPNVIHAEETTPTTTESTTVIEQLSTEQTPVTEPTTTQQTTTSTTETVITTEQTTSTNQTTAQLTIRVNDQLIFSGSPVLNSATTTVTDKTGGTHEIVGNSVLGVLHQEDDANDAFAITKIGYFAGIGLYIECITVNGADSCNNWQYTVNDVYSYFSVDANLLKQSDDVYLYFGNQNQFTLSTTTVKIGEPLGITTEKYDYRNNTWVARPNVTVGATQFDPANPWTPIVITSTLADSLGKATIYFNATGTLDIGIGDDYYYPTQTVTILEAANNSTSTETTSTPSVTTNTSGGSGGSSATNNETVVTFDIAKAIQFLGTQQDQTTGAIGSASLYSDWAAIAVGSYTNSGAVKTKLATYLQTDPNPGSAATDFERRAMALMALGISPYSGTKTNYINEILKTYQGNQFGDTGLVNDDIFAVIPLLKAGYTTTDTEIKNSVAFILSRQNSAGGWESPDLTAAAVQALTPVNSLPGVVEALAKAKNYLKISTKADGRIGDNSFSTSWGTQAIVSLGETVTIWNGSNDSPLTYLAKQQQTDGGIDSAINPIDGRIWSTSYAIPAAQNKIWLDVLNSFTRVEPQTITQTQNGAGGGGVEATSTPATTTSTTTVPVIATTTPIIIKEATTTPAIIIEKTTNSTATNTNNSSPFTESLSALLPIVPVVKKTTPIISVSRNTITPEPMISNNTPNLSGENLTVAPTENSASDARRVFGGAAAVAGTAGAYLAWRFFQSLV